jgi:hypothetical protein
VHTYVRIDPPDEDPERLLDPEHQQSEPWSWPGTKADEGHRQQTA